MKAEFLVRDALNLAGRGPVLVGDIVAGAIGAGMHLPLADGTSLCVISVEFVDTARDESHVGLLLADAPPAAELMATFPPGTQLTFDDATRPSAATSEPSTRNTALRRFWYPLPRHFGIGVTAVSEAEARSMAAEVLARHYPAGLGLAHVVADADISTLDAHHVLPNIGSPVVRGVWYPRLNL